MSLANSLKFWNETRSASSPTSLSQLPQELIDQILDVVALECFRDSGDGKLNDLKACSLVSKFFYTRSRYHIFSHILFNMDKHSQRRAARLLNVLRQHQSLAHVVTHRLHTFGLICDDSNASEPFLSRMLGVGKSFERLQQRVGRILFHKNHIYDMLGMIKQAPIVHFSLEGWRLFDNYSDGDEDQVIDSVLRTIKNPSLRTLRFSELIALPQKLLHHALVSSQLRELTLRRIPYFLPSPETSDPVEGLQIAPNLERLELRRVPYSAFMSFVRALSQGGVAKTIITYPTFRRLRTLVVTIANLHSEMEFLWTLLLGLAPSLENLDIQHTGWLVNPWPNTVCLSQLIALKHIIFTTSLTAMASTLYEEYITSLLLSASSPIILESIEINLYKQGNSSQEVFDSIYPNNGWENIDCALNNPNFVNLTEVVCNLRPFYWRWIPSARVRNPTAQRIDARPLLPLTCESSSVLLSCYLMPMSGPHDIWK